MRVPKEAKPLLFPVEGAGGFEIVSVYDTNPWETLTSLLLRHKVSKPISFFPPELALESLFHVACRAIKIPTTAGTVYNLPATLELVHTIEHDALVTTAPLSEILLDAYENKYSLKAPFSIIVVTAGINEKIKVEKAKEGLPSAQWFEEKNPIRKYL